MTLISTLLGGTGPTFLILPILGDIHGITATYSPIGHGGGERI